MGGYVRTAVIVVVAAGSLVPVHAADKVIRRKLPRAGRVEIILPAAASRVQFRAELAVSAGSDIFVAQVLHGRRMPGDTPALLTAGYDEMPAGVVRSLACPVDISCTASSNGGEARFGVGATLPGGARLVFVWEAEEASLEVTSSSPVTVVGADRRYARLGVSPFPVAGGMVVQATPGADLTASGTVALASIPCVGSIGSRARLTRGRTVVAEWSCAGRTWAVATAALRASPTWHLAGDLVGMSSTRTRLVTVYLQ